MTYSEQTRPPWKAFMPTAKKVEAEWTREMDVTIADAVGESVWVGGKRGNGGWVPSYSIELGDVVRAAEKWCQRTLRVFQLARRQDGSYLALITPGWPITAKAPTPALALAKALYAAIKAEESSHA